MTTTTTAAGCLRASLALILLAAQASCLQPDQLLLALGTSSERLPLLHASRSARGGVPAVVLLEDEAAAQEAQKQQASAHGKETFIAVKGDMPKVGPLRHSQRRAVRVLAAGADCTLPNDRSQGGPSRDAYRQAAALVAAHELSSGGGNSSAGYRWLLWGEDGTLWLLPRVLRLLQHLDAELPYALADNLAYHDGSPSVIAPRCLPCNHSVHHRLHPHLHLHTQHAARHAGQTHHRMLRQQLDGDQWERAAEAEAEAGEAQEAAPAHDSSWAYPVPPSEGCPCSPELACTAGRSASWDRLHTSRALAGEECRQAGLDTCPGVCATSANQSLSLNAGEPGAAPAGRVASSAGAAQPPACLPQALAAQLTFGGGPAPAGAGLIVSRGFMLRHARQLQSCLQQGSKCSDAGCLLARCIWAAGAAFTDPGPGLMSQDRGYTMFGSPRAQAQLAAAGEAVAGGHCDEYCAWLLTHSVSVEVRTRPPPTPTPALPTAQKLVSLAPPCPVAMACADLQPGWWLRPCRCLPCSPGCRRRRPRCSACSGATSGAQQRWRPARQALRAAARGARGSK
jgi:hypothetical protein